MNISNICYITAAFLSFFSCNDLPKDVKQTLELAGNNKKELQKVIDHYQKPEDSLKLEAAYFLIRNIMPYRTYIDLNESEELKQFFQSVEDSLKPYFRKESNDNFVERAKIYNNIKEQSEIKTGVFSRFDGIMKKDIETISSSFLIENIEYAFKAWNLPWSNSYSFEEFCEYILPYKRGKQNPNSWRSFFFNEFKSFRDSIGNETDAIVVATKLNKFLNNKKFIASGLKNFSYKLQSTNMYKYKLYANCVALSSLALETMRSIGIPITEVWSNKYGRTGKDHISNAILDESGAWQYFNILYGTPGEMSFKHDITKIYRKKTIDKEILTNKKIKAFNKLGVLGWEDITNEVTKTYNIELKPSITIKENEIVYLCVFNNRLKDTWVPIDWALVDNNNELVFKDIGGKDVVYLAMVNNKQNSLTPISDPFILKTDGTLNYIKGADEKISVQLKRKFPLKPRLKRIAKSLIGGQFEASNFSNFKDYKIIHRIIDSIDSDINLVNVEDVAYRYYRFVYPPIEDNLKYDVAEFAYGTKEDNEFIKKEGDYISSKGINENIVETFFDSDLLTYSSIYKKKGVLKGYNPKTREICSNISEKVWIGLDLGSIQKVSQIYYCPRTGKNGIYPNMRYELFYWNNEWVSLGVKKAEEYSLTYESPVSGALYLLKCLDEGKEERIFTYESGKQIWW